MNLFLDFGCACARRRVGGGLAEKDCLHRIHSSKLAPFQTHIKVSTSKLACANSPFAVAPVIVWQSVAEGLWAMRS